MIDVVVGVRNRMHLPDPLADQLDAHLGGRIDEQVPSREFHQDARPGPLVPRVVRRADRAITADHGDPGGGTTAEEHQPPKGRHRKLHQSRASGSTQHRIPRAQGPARPRPHCTAPPRQWRPHSGSGIADRSNIINIFIFNIFLYILSKSNRQAPDQQKPGPEDQSASRAPRGAGSIDRGCRGGGACGTGHVAPRSRHLRQPMR